MKPKSQYEQLVEAAAKSDDRERALRLERQKAAEKELVNLTREVARVLSERFGVDVDVTFIKEVDGSALERYEGTFVVCDEVFDFTSRGYIVKMTDAAVTTEHKNAVELLAEIDRRRTAA